MEDTATLAARLRDSGKALLGLRGALVAGEPWPLSETWGTEPEASWGPREVLAHVDEMLPYWTEQLHHVLAGAPGEAVPFGRVASDASRLERIDEHRRHGSGRLLDDIDVGLEEAAEFVAALRESDARRVGAHPTRGEVTVRDSVERFLVNHLEEHVAQLRSILDRA